MLERELAPDLDPPPAWNEKQRLLTVLVEPVTRTEVRCPAHRRGRMQCMCAQAMGVKEILCHPFVSGDISSCALYV